MVLLLFAKQRFGFESCGKVTKKKLGGLQQLIASFSHRKVQLADIRKCRETLL
jgi:hypothetical protein